MTASRWRWEEDEHFGVPAHSHLVLTFFGHAFKAIMHFFGHALKSSDMTNKTKGQFQYMYPSVLSFILFVFFFLLGGVMCRIFFSFS